MNGHSGSVQQTLVHRYNGKKPLFELSYVSFIHMTVSLPLVSLFFCLISAVLFQYEKVNVTDTCSHMSNLVPSVSAVTGVTPQRYIWRFCIALHSAPRIIIGFMYWNYYMNRMTFIAPQKRPVYRKLASLIFWVYNIEHFGLCGVAFIANVENYPVHEKIFVIFMVTSILHQILTVSMFRWAHPDINSSPQLMKSLKYKTYCLISISLCTSALVYYFLMHKFYCAPGAFSMFSALEYIIAVINILFHWTTIIEFKNMKLFVGEQSVLVEENLNDEHIPDANKINKD